MKKLLLFASVLWLTSCVKDAESVSKKGNYNIEFLFEQNGCKIYRFYDDRYIYFSDCSGKTSYQYRSGKVTMQQDQLTF